MIAKRKAMLSTLEISRNICYNAEDRMQALLLRPISIFFVSIQLAGCGVSCPRAICMIARDRLQEDKDAIYRGKK